MKTSLFRLISVCFMGSAVASCSLPSDVMTFEKAQAFENSKEFDKAVHFYERAFKLASSKEIKLKASDRLSHILEFQLKDYPRAKKYLKYTVVGGKDLQQTKAAELRLANINFYHLSHFQKAISNFSRLLAIEKDPRLKKRYRLNIAKSYNQLGNFSQALIELENSMSKESDNFSALLLKANILQSKRELLEAIKIFETLLQLYPEKARNNEVYMSLSVCFEQNFQMQKAIGILRSHKKYHKSEEFIDYRIRRLEKRASNLPRMKKLKR